MPYRGRADFFFAQRMFQTQQGSEPSISQIKMTPPGPAIQPVKIDAFDDEIERSSDLLFPTTICAILNVPFLTISKRSRCQAQ